MAELPEDITPLDSSVFFWANQKRPERRQGYGDLSW